MLKKVGPKGYLFPMPTLMIGTYNEDGSPDAMMMAWGGICDYDKVAMNISSTHRTADNIRRTGVFTLSVPSVDTLKQCDFLGTASAKKYPDKFARTGLHEHRSEIVDAPIVEEWPITLECEVIEMQEQPYGLRVLGKILNTFVDDRIMDEDGNIDPGKIGAFIFDQIRNGYYAVGEKVGQAWHDGLPLLK